MADFVTRFAPSPTGFLHLGHAFSALTAFDAAQSAGGRFLLRMEDIDRARCKPAFEEAIYEDLAWIGLTWEGPVRRQSDHLADYAGALETLIAKNIVYRCFKTRKEIADAIAAAPHFSADGPEGPHYVGEALAPSTERTLLDEGAPYAWRLSMARARAYLGDAWTQLAFEDADIGAVAATPEIFGDPVIARKDAGTSYHIASVVDDALQGITHVIRGEDLRAAAHLHRLLQALLELPTPIYLHHRLITDKNGKRLAKRDKDATLRAMREAGARAEDVRARLGMAQVGNLNTPIRSSRT